MRCSSSDIRNIHLKKKKVKKTYSKQIKVHIVHTMRHLYLYSEGIFASMTRKHGDMEIYDEKICRCALNRLFGFRPAVAIALVDAFGSAASVFGADRKELPPGTLKYFGAGGICDEEYMKSESELERLSAEGVEFIRDGDPAYPDLLAECPDRPMGLYVKSRSGGEEVFMQDRLFISVVGTRDMSAYGKEWCRRLIFALADTGRDICIVSGLALGCDITAHRAALERGLPTIAVLPAGIDTIYPYRHSADADRIRKAEGGALVTDYPPGTAPLQINFVRRNRIIAGISGAVILIESKVRGGGMITARLAFSYSRDIYALPGRADDIRSAGCNLLVREKTAEPVVSEAGLLDSLGLTGRQQSPAARNDRTMLAEKFSGLDRTAVDGMSDILVAVRKERGIDIETLSARCGLGYGRTLELAMLLESDGIISIDLMQRCSINIK